MNLPYEAIVRESISDVDLHLWRAVCGHSPPLLFSVPQGTSRGERMHITHILVPCSLAFCRAARKDAKNAMNLQCEAIVRESTSGKYVLASVWGPSPSLFVSVPKST